jgi:pimeloyl-ACP methyl ester carboxylesterase
MTVVGRTRTAKVPAEGFSCLALTRMCGGRAGGPRSRNWRKVAPVPERKIAANGIELNVLDEGAGPLVVLCHGFPELAFSWRHQVPALTEAGYRVLAPDMRGYGHSSAPAEIDAYDVVTLCGDMCGLLDAAGQEAAVFVGHDWGANVTWQLAVLAPERVRAVAGLSVPFVPRAPAPPIPIMRRHLGEDFYIVWFQQPGVADAALASDVRRTLTTSRQWTAQWAAGARGSERRAAGFPARALRQTIATVYLRGTSEASAALTNVAGNAVEQA